MGNFTWPEWKPLPQDTPPPSAPPPDPMVAREEKIANDTRVEQALTGATVYFIKSYFKYVGTGGLYDYQRRGSQISGLLGGGFAHRRQFRSVSNFNVGLFCQQAGLTLEDTLALAGTYSTLFGATDRKAPYNLKGETAKFIKEGYMAGQSSAFDPIYRR